MTKTNTAQSSRRMNVFAAAEARFGEIVGELGSEERLRMDLSELEKLLQAKGSELLRELLQGHMDLRSLAQVDEPVVGSDGVDRRDVHRRSRSIKTVFGTVELERERFHSAGRPGLAPADAELNLPTQQASLELRRRVAASRRDVFDEVVEEIAETTGTQLAKRQVEELALAAALGLRRFLGA